jgi:Bacterial-like globin
MTARKTAVYVIALGFALGVAGCGSMQGSTGLIDQLGGSAQLKTLSDAFVNNAASDPRTSQLLSGANLGALKTKVSDQFCATIGGSCTAPLTSAQITEAGKKVDAPTSSALTDSLTKALDSIKASPVVKEGVTKLLGPQLGGIVAGLV